MTSTLSAPELTATPSHTDVLDTAQAVIVLVSPSDARSQCNDAVSRAALAGAVTFTCEVDTDATWLDEIDRVMDAVDDAAALFPGLPVVLVGHDHAGPIAVLAAEACRESISGLVLTKSQHASTCAA